MRKATVLVLAALTALVAAPPASANFHLMKIREVRITSTPFVELQMWAAGQTQLAGHQLTIYNASGVPTSVPLTSVNRGENQRSILIGGPGSIDGVTPDIAATLNFDLSGGAVCFDAIPVDCVLYGAFGGTTPDQATPPVTGYPAADPAMSITRSIAAGCSTLLESSDDTDHSTPDFTITAATPRNNATVPTETACGGVGGGGGGNDDPPRTTITKSPDKELEKTTAKFKFESSEQGSDFQCKLDKKPFKDCTSPQKYKHLDEGKHKFQVFATDRDGNADKTPAKYRFEVVDG